MPNETRLTPANEAVETRLVQQLNDLYVMERKKMLIQTNSGYITRAGTEAKPYVLVDKILQQHVLNNMTIGVYSGKHLTKIIGFDVDMKEFAPSATIELVECLTDTYGLSLNNLLVSYSGNKGYHVDVFLDKAIALVKARQFYHLVLQELGYSFNEIELRPTAGQGYKLPLSVHRKTGNIACIVDSQTLVELPRERILDVIKADTDMLLEQLPAEELEKNTLTLDADTAEQFEDAIADYKEFVPKDYRHSMAEILTAGTLLYADTRNRTTLFLSIFLKEQGYTQEETTAITASVIRKTYEEQRELIDASTTLEYALKECKRLSKLVFDKDYSIAEHKRKPIRIYKQDVLLTLQPKRKQHRQLLFSMIAHSKRYADAEGSFYMAYSVMTKVGNTANRVRLAKATEALEEQGLISVIQRNKRHEKRLKSEANVYSINYTQEPKDVRYVELDNIDVNDWAKVVTQLVKESELRQLVTKRVYETTFRDYYKA